MSALEDGKLAGQKLLTLFADLGFKPEHQLRALPLGEIESVLQQLWSRSSANTPEPRLVGFLSQIIPAATVGADILNIWGLRQLLDDQSRVAPVCNIPRKSGLIAFADWTGESDGDCWCYDIPYACLRCIPVSAGYADANQSRLESYGVFPNLHHFAAYLRCEAELREWI